MWRIILLDSQLSRLQMLRSQVQQMRELPMQVQGMFTSAQDMFFAQRIEECDLIVCALSLRDTDAFGLLEQLKMCGSQRPWILVVYPVQRERLEEELYRAGADDCMHCPLDAGEIFGRAARLLGRGREERLFLQRKIEQFLDAKQINRSDVGWRYVVKAVEILIENQLDCKLVHTVYMEVGKKENVRPSAVESGIRRVVDKLQRDSGAGLQGMVEGTAKLSNGSFLKQLAAQIMKES